MPQEISSRTVFSKEIQTPCLVLFRSETCDPCHKVTPLFRKLEQELPQMKFLEVEASSGKRVMNMENIDGFPTINYYNGGKLLKSFNPDSKSYSSFKKQVIRKTDNL